MIALLADELTIAAIGHELGLSFAGVGTLLARARLTLGCATTSQMLIAIRYRRS